MAGNLSVLVGSTCAVCRDTVIILNWADTQSGATSWSAVEQRRQARQKDRARRSIAVAGGIHETSADDGNLDANPPEHDESTDQRYGPCRVMPVSTATVATAGTRRNHRHGDPVSLWMDETSGQIICSPSPPLPHKRSYAQ